MINNLKIKVLLEDTAGGKENFLGEIKLNNEDKIKQYEECKKKIKDGIKGMIEMVEQEKEENRITKEWETSLTKELETLLVPLTILTPEEEGLQEMAEQEKEESRITKERETLLTPEQDNDEINMGEMGLRQQPVEILTPEGGGLQEMEEDETELSELEDGPKINRKRKLLNYQETLLENYQRILLELSTPTERTVEEENEMDNIGNDLTKRYIRANRSSRRAMKEWYEYGRIFMGRMEEIKNGNRRKIKEQTARQKLYKEIKGNLVGETSLSAIKVNTQRALKIYDLFHKIGIDKINRIKSCSRDNLATLRTEEINKLVEYFREKEGR